MENENKAKRNYKDSVFVDLFSKCDEAKENFISLYNALHGTSLTAEDTEVKDVSLEQTVYTGRYNDVSMLIDNRIVVLVEQQSTINENMPLRFLEYIARIYEKLISLEKRYERKLIPLPEPEFYVFYNGTEDYPVEKELKLSDAFKINGENKEYPLELTAKVYNIGKEQNIDFIRKCAVLFGYAKLTEYAAEAKKNGIENYLDKAVLRCIKEGFLTEYLKKNSTEVRNMLIAEYSYEDDMKVQWNVGYEEGVSRGISQGIQKGISQQKAEDEKIILAERRKLSQRDSEIEKLRAEIERLKTAAASHSF